MSLRAYSTLTTVTLLFGIVILSAIDVPGYTDAYYYYNAAERLVEGKGLTDPYLWNYINAPEEIPTESHRYWMPLTSLAAAVPMWIAGTGFNVAQWGFLPFYIALTLMGMCLGWRFTQSKRYAWFAGISVMLGGFFLPFWLTTDAFALFGALGCGALIAMGKGAETENWRWYVLGGVLAALAHLTRADGLLLVLVGLIVILRRNPSPQSSPRKQGEEASSFPYRVEQNVSSPLVERRLRGEVGQGAVFLLAYFLVMLPWFIRSINAFGAPLPAGGIETAFLKGYNNIFSYPAEWSLSEFLDWGAGNILQSRLQSFQNTLGTWLIVEGFILLSPLALWKIWQLRRDPFLAPFIWYALGLHLAMTFVFAYPSIQGALFHSSAALLPYWVALGLAGLDDLIGRVARWRRWRPGEARLVFGSAIVLLPVFISYLAWQRQSFTSKAETYQTYADLLPENARIMVNDPAVWYYYTDLMGVTIPNNPPADTREIAERYCLTHLIIDKFITAPFEPLLKGEPPPPFLTEIHHLEGSDPDDWSDDVRLFAFDVACTP